MNRRLLPPVQVFSFVVNQPLVGSGVRPRSVREGDCTTSTAEFLKVSLVRSFPLGLIDTRAQNKLWCRSTEETQQNLRLVAP